MCEPKLGERESTPPESNRRLRRRRGRPLDRQRPGGARLGQGRRATTLLLLFGKLFSDAVARFVERQLLGWKPLFEPDDGHSQRAGAPAG